MKTTRRQVIGAALTTTAAGAAQTQTGPVKYVRYTKGGAAAWGVLEGESIREVRGDLYGNHRVGGVKAKLSDVKLLAPGNPPKILAVGLNYKSHLGNRVPPPMPEIFYKPITCQQDPEAAIVLPRDSTNVHYEGELVIAIGKRASNITKEQAKDVIFGVTCGNDVSEREWQNGAKKDLQWWRAKGADTFGPYGPCLVRGLNYGNLLLQTRLNGKVVQKQSTSDLLYDCETIVSVVSRYVTLTPGDLIFTGTPGSTAKMSPGDTVEVEIEGIGVLKNKVTAAS